jgi:hypothetical protein
MLPSGLVPFTGRAGTTLGTAVGGNTGAFNSCPAGGFGSSGADDSIVSSGGGLEVPWYGSEALDGCWAHITAVAKAKKAHATIGRFISSISFRKAKLAVKT